ncbi:MAG: hypothetical protein EU521_01175 [Promethearchaeota archaeon]|nr:MAG: hypothetical protein EU521_01175 [Candidatus Lokiarchaeota archaeon]
MNFRKYITLKNFNYIGLVLFLSSILLAIFYLLIPIYNLSWHILGITYIGAMIFGFIFFYFLSRKLNKSIKIAYRINSSINYYFLLIIIGMFLMLFGNFFISVSYSNSLFNLFGFYFMVYFGYFSPLSLGLIISIVLIKKSNKNRIFVKENNPHNEKPLKKDSKVRQILGSIPSLIAAIVIIAGIYAVILIFTGDRGIIGMFLPEFGLFMTFIFLSMTFFLIKKIAGLQSKKVQYFFYALSLIGLIISGIFSLPFISTPIAINNAEVNFSQAFGSNWRSSIGSDISSKYFLQSQFAIPQYFLGVYPEECIIERDILYFDGSESSYPVDENITLYFDLYMPQNKGVGLPGENSTLIRIHGGAWRSYDKGITNMLQMNKYFAAQGYIVFDIQYGLYRPDRDSDALTPLNVLGNFSIDDMIRHIGNFTYYLEKNSDKFGANLNSVFISGGSAGGHLTCASALAIASGNYFEIFSSALTIKGLIPFYPANLLPLSYGTDELIRPSKLVNGSSPPCLIFQGIQDGLVPWTVSQTLKNAYKTANNDACALILFPFAGHANDIYFSGHFNLVFLYYMERFMYLVH